VGGLEFFVFFFCAQSNKIFAVAVAVAVAAAVLLLQSDGAGCQQQYDSGGGGNARASGLGLLRCGQWWRCGMPRASSPWRTTAQRRVRGRPDALPSGWAQPRPPASGPASDDYLEAVVAAVRETRLIHGTDTSGFYAQVCLFLPPLFLLLLPLLLSIIHLRVNVKGLWEELVPADWRDFLAAVPAEDLVQLPLARSFAGAQGAVPRSLATLLARLDQLTLARECAFGGGAGLAAADRHVLAQLARRQSPKKRHECDQLAGLVRELAHADGTGRRPWWTWAAAWATLPASCISSTRWPLLGIDGDAALVTAGDQRLQSLPPVAGTPCQLVSCYVHGPEDLIGACSAAGGARRPPPASTRAET
jgi:hypothetical protein